MVVNYRGSRIETILTKDIDPTYVVVIDGIYYTNRVSDDNEEKAIENAKKEIDKQIEHKKKVDNGKI